MNTRTQIIVAAVAGQLLAQLGWVDAVYIPFVVAGPIVVGAVAATKDVPLVPVLVLWVSAGLNMTVLDWLINGEDVVFHLALTVVMSLLAAAGYGVLRLATRRRRASVTPA
jgi:hypothetical protein